MAEPLPQVPDRGGYFYTPSFEDLWDYVIGFLHQERSIRIHVHTQGLFQKEGGEDTEIHIMNNISFNLDEDMDNWDDIRRELEDYCTNPDNFQADYAGSGLVLLGITMWFLRILPYQGNHDAVINNQNVVLDAEMVVPDDEESDEEYQNIFGVNAFWDALYYAIHPKEARNKNRNNQKVRVFKWWIENRLHGKEHIVNMSEVSAWHEEYGQYNIVIFNQRGNIIYNRSLSPDSEEVLFILYKSANRKFYAIKKLQALFQERSNAKVLCMKCQRFHNEGMCEIHLETAMFPSVTLPRKPLVKHRVVMYADFEAVATVGHVHEPTGYVLIFLEDDKLVEVRVKDITQSDDIIEDFFIDIEEMLKAYQERGHPRRTQLCHICEKIKKNEIEEDYMSARNYINGKDGRVHIDCFKRTENSCPIIFHNWKGYDNHHVIRKIVSTFDDTNISAKSFEKIDNILIGKDWLRIKFGDSMNFLQGSLSNLGKTIKNWKHTPENHQSVKALFPYDWFDSTDKLHEPIPMDPNQWGSKLNGTTSVDIDEVVREIDKNQIEDFRGWHNFYMERDGWVLLEVFEEFRKTVFEAEGIDPVYFQGAPSLTWYLAIRSAGEKEFKIIQNIDLYLQIQANIRGGVSQCMKRYVDVSTAYDEYLLYWDVNSLYSSCMLNKLPTQWVKTYTEFTEDDLHEWINYDQDDDFCALFECDLGHEDEMYDENTHMHDFYREMPPVPHSFTGRLCTTFLDKDNYLVHNQLLKFYLEHGVFIRKIHKVVIFKQKAVMAKYVDDNIKKRIAAEGNDSYQNLYKLLNNSVYGKTCENVLKYKSFKVEQIDDKTEGQRNKFLATTKNFLIIDDKAYCEMHKTDFELCKPIQLGFAILEFAKLTIYKMWYKLKETFRDRVELCYTDTDSILLHFKGFEVHPLVEIQESHPELLAMLDFEKGVSPIKTQGTYKVSGLWSDEIDGKLALRFCGLRSKTYAVEFDDESEKLKNKGITRNALIHQVDRRIKFEDYVTALFDAKEIRVHQYTMRSRKHEIMTISQNKLALSSNDGKRIVLPDRVNTVPFGYRGKQFIVLDDYK